ncbi:MAG: hypothetical protein L3J91_04625, partial [Thermoplasmata archaeon]|nr:hypothetical protein [Thermoplasmata archaeon]
MSRTTEAADGLALLGVARVGPIGFRVPNLAYAKTASRPSPAAPIPLTIESAPGRAEGRRGIVLSEGEARLELDFAVPTAEVSGVPGSLEFGDPGVAFVHAPLAESDLERLRLA